jgi:hypothetical protein
MNKLMLRGSLAGSLTTALIGLATVAASAGSQTQTYIVPAGDMLSLHGGGLDAADVMPKVACNAEGVESVCFDLNGGGKVHLEIADKTGQPTAVRIFFYDSSMAYVDTNAVRVCASGDVDIPDGAAKMEVRVGMVGRGTWSIPPSQSEVQDMVCGQPSPASTGTVTASGKAIAGASRSDSAAGTGTVTSKVWTAAPSAPAVSITATPTRFLRTARPV